MLKCTDVGRTLSASRIQQLREYHIELGKDEGIRYKEEDYSRSGLENEDPQLCQAMGRSNHSLFGHLPVFVAGTVGFLSFVFAATFVIKRHLS